MIIYCLILQLNAAYCDEVVRIEEKVARVKEERRQVASFYFVLRTRNKASITETSRLSDGDFFAGMKNRTAIDSLTFFLLISMFFV